MLEDSFLLLLLFLSLRYLPQECLFKLLCFKIPWNNYSVLLCYWLATPWGLCVCACLVAQRIKHLPAMQETQVQSLGWEDPLEKEMATNFSILVWRIRWTEEPGRLQSTGSQIVRHNWATSLSLFCTTSTTWEVAFWTQGSGL